MLGVLSAVAGPVVKGLFNIIDQTVEDKDQAARIKANIASQQNELIQTELKGAIDIILAEAKGNWLQKSWRPLLMMSVMAIVVNNYILFPYLSMWTEKVVVLELPGGLWTLLTTGVGGYVVGRSGEKIAQSIKNG
jgi:hypothetical protein